MELSDAQKIEKLWGSLQKTKESEASLQVLLEVTEAKVDKLQNVIQQQKNTIDALSNEIKRLGIELNAAREAAANSVRNYIAEVN